MGFGVHVWAVAGSEESGVGVLVSGVVADSIFDGRGELLL